MIRKIASIFPRAQLDALLEILPTLRNAFHDPLAERWHERGRIRIVDSFGLFRFILPVILILFEVGRILFPRMPIPLLVMATTGGILYVFIVFISIVRHAPHRGAMAPDLFAESANHTLWREVPFESSRAIGLVALGRIFSRVGRDLSVTTQNGTVMIPMIMVQLVVPFGKFNSPLHTIGCVITWCCIVQIHELSRFRWVSIENAWRGLDAFLTLAKFDNWSTGWFSKDELKPVLNILKVKTGKLYGRAKNLYYLWNILLVTLLLLIAARASFFYISIIGVIFISAWVVETIVRQKATQLMAKVFEENVEIWTPFFDKWRQNISEAQTIAPH